MKAKIVLRIILLLLPLAALPQQKSDTLQHSQIFSLLPVSKKVDKVNGMAFGLGHFWDRKSPLTVNGLNLEINPVTPLILLFQDPDRMENDTIILRHNGLHISIGGFSGCVAHNGLGISVYNIGVVSNGLSITGVYNTTQTMNGLHISGLANTAKKGTGIFIAPINGGADYTGLQVGVYNKATTMKGLQIGLFNRSEKTKGLQLGLWNMNGRRSLPFINW